MSRLLRRIALLAAAILVIGAVASLVAWRVLRSAPTWYAPPDAAQPATAERAETVEYRVVEELHRIREDEEPWTLTLSAAEANAWLAARLPEWLAHESELDWPASLGTPQVRFDDGRIDVAVPWRSGDHEEILVARLAPAEADGAATLRLTAIGIGRMLLPAESLESLARRAEQPGEVELLGVAIPRDALRGCLELRDAIPAGGIRLTDGRRVEILALAARTGRLEILQRTLRREASPVDPG